MYISVLFVTETGYEQDALKATIEVITRYGCTKTLGTVQRGSLRPFGIGVLADRTLTTFAPAYLRDAKNIYGSLPINFCIVKAKLKLRIKSAQFIMIIAERRPDNFCCRKLSNRNHTRKMIFIQD
ncbi:glycoside hydrolase, family 32 [Artemisia annua]|uniref:Glycoside hydrolase, family 32 n=1 Tax=Artemisia annua TaxID=35608 RepID=A0A2U1PI67_ARTAN|nr:glycoside hydrolase, family 32 [Artemisia annua]